MALTPGTRLGVYEIQSSIGEGGMGQVYRAIDTTLARVVAIKTLPEAFAADPERVARFEREAKTLASLNHPNISAIHAIEKSNGIHALVMEFADGQDLSQRLTSGPIPIDEALPIAAQIAEALETAHEHGVIHRDLKPANIKVTSDGRVKVLDFGLAKALSADTPQASAITSPAMTVAGVVLGTAAYMSPEQAKGRPVDKRADVWSFGVVLYEMLTGRRLFDGESIAEVLGGVLRQEIDLTKLPAALPASTVELLRRCLDRDPRTRLRDLGEARVALLAAALDAPPSSVAAAPVRRPSQRLAWTVAAIAIIAMIAMGVVSQRMWRRAEPEALPIRFVISQPDHLRMNRSGVERTISISANGRMVAYGAADGSIVVRGIDSLEAIPVSGITAGRSPFFSPDGKWIGFFDGTNALKKVPIAGGPAIEICKISAPPRGASWREDDTIIFATAGVNEGLFAVPAGGGEVSALTKPDAAKGGFHQLPWVLPRNAGTLFTAIGVRGNNEADLDLAVRDNATSEVRTLVRGASDGRYVEPGVLLYASGGALKAVRFDLSSLRVTGDPVTVVEGIAVTRNGAAQYDVSSSGALVYVPAVRDDSASNRSLVWKNRNGDEQPVANVAPRAYSSLRLSPDDSRVALEIADQGNDIWVWHVANQTLTRLTDSPETEAGPVWTPDGKRLIFSRGQLSGGLRILWQPADGTAPAETLTEATSRWSVTSVGRDGQTLLVRDYRSSSFGLGVFDLSTRRFSVVLDSRATENEGQISPDGRWLAYLSNESRVAQIYVNSFPDVARSRVQVSPSGGIAPAWSRDGRELYFVSSSALFSVRVTGSNGDELSFGPPVRLFDLVPVGGSETGRSYDVSRDGQRFIVIKPSAAEIANATTPQRLVVVVNWTTELQRLLTQP